MPSGPSLHVLKFMNIHRILTSGTPFSFRVAGRSASRTPAGSNAVVLLQSYGVAQPIQKK
ncbi:MAG: hypothetical protein CL919_07770 [Deltaproteobacteria bacterium]|nr:hypothetical protein [Deltaproteobacteria bacterium]